MKTWLKRIFIGVAVLLALIAVSLVWLVGTESGRLWLSEKGRGFAADAGIEIAYQNLRSPKLGEWRADRVTVQLQAQPMVEVQDFVLLWRPSALLHRQLQIDHLSATRVDYNHLERQSAPEQEDAASGGFPESPLTLSLTQFQIDTLALHNLPSVQGRKLPDYRIQGAAEAFGDRFPLQVQIELRSLASNETAVLVDTQAVSESEVFISGSIAEAPGGLLGSLLQWPEGDQLQADFRFGLEKDNDNLRVAIEKLEASVAGHPLSAQGTLEYAAEKETLTVNELVLLVDDKRQLLRGGYSAVDLWAQLDLNSLPLDLATPWYADLKGGTATGTVELSWLHHDTGRWPSVSADLDAAVQYQNHRLSIDIRGALEQKLLSLEPSRLQLEGAVISAQGALDLESDKSDLRGTLTNFHTNLLKPWPKVPIPEELSASTQLAKFHFRGSVKNPDISVNSTIDGNYREQAFRLVIDGRSSLKKAHVKKMHLALAGSELNATGTLDWTDNTTDLSASFANLNRDLLRLAPETVAAQVPEELTFVANGEAQIAGPLRQPKVRSQSRISGTYEISNEPLPYVLDLHGSVDVGNLANLVIRAEQVQLSLFDSPTLTLKGHYSARAMDLSLQMTKLPTQALAALGMHRIKGEAEADLKLTGTLEKPQINGYLEYRDQLRGRGKRRVPLAMHLDLVTEQDLLQLAATLKHDQEVAGNLDLVLPLGLYLKAQGKQVPLDLRADGKWDLEFLRLFIDMGAHRVEGQILADFTVTGTVDQPILRGQLQLQNGTYGNFVTGTQLEKIQLSIVGEGEHLAIREGRARSGDGELQLGGDIYWQQDRRLLTDAIDLTLKARNAALVQRRDVQGEVQGELKINGSFEEIWIKGELEISPLNANIDSAIKTRIPEIKVTEVKDDLDVEMANASTMPIVHLDISLVASQQAYLRGRGLDTELKGRIFLEGTASDPQYRGQFNTVRGRIDLFGKRFMLDNGEVRFNNTGVILRIPAVYKGSDIEIRAEVYGTAEEPKLALSSIPALPDDEILSRLIFGKSVQEITAFEAIRLAGAVRSLTSGGGFDPVDSARALLGVDSLTIDSAANETSGRSDYTVGVGKYINERVYVELGRSSNPMQPWSGSVEIELTPKITLESRTTEKGGAGTELMWKKDY